MADITPPLVIDIRPCQVCSRERQVHVRCCGFGPMSLAYCEECLITGAEPEFGFQYLWDWVGGRKRENLVPELDESFCWVGDAENGRYWSWDEWVENELKNPRPEPEMPEEPDEQKVVETDFSALSDFGFEVVKEAKSDES